MQDWDVVNEAIDTSAPNGLRNSMWLQIIGPEYIDLAFQFAEEVLNGAGSLYINDYNSHEVGKRTALAKVVQGLLDRGIRDRWRGSPDAYSDRLALAHRDRAEPGSVYRHGTGQPDHGAGRECVFKQY